MGRPIEIQIDATTAGAEDGIDRLGASLERVSDALDDTASSARSAESSVEGVGDAGTDAGREIERSLTDAARKFRDLEREARETGSDTEDYWRDAAQEIERHLEQFRRTGTGEFDQLEDTAKDTALSIDRDLTKALDNAGDGAKRGLADAGREVETFRDETRQNLSESVSSFRGDVEDIPQLLQDVLGGVSADLGAVGGLAAAGAAALIGITIQQLQDMADRINTAKEEAASLAAELIEAGGDIDRVDLAGKMREWALEIGDARQWWEVWQSDARTNLEIVAKATQKTGDDFGALWEAMASGDADTAREALAGLRAEQEDLARVIAEGTTVVNGYTTVMSDEAKAAAETSETRQQLIRVLEEHIKKTEDATALEEAYSKTADGVRAALEAQNDAIKENNDAKAKAAGIVADVFTAEGDYAEAVRDATAALTENGATLDSGTEAGQANREALVALAAGNRDWQEAAAAAGQNQAAVNEIAQRGYNEFVGLATSMGMSEAEATDLARSLGLIPGNVSTTHVFTSDAAAKVAALVGPSFIPGAGAAVGSVLGRIPATITTKLTVDDTALRNYRPPTIEARVMVRPGQRAAI